MVKLVRTRVGGGASVVIWKCKHICKILTSHGKVRGKTNVLQLTVGGQGQGASFNHFCRHLF